MNKLTIFIFLLVSMKLSMSYLVLPSHLDNFTTHSPLANLTNFMIGFYTVFSLPLGDSVLCFDEETAEKALSFMESAYSCAGQAKDNEAFQGACKEPSMLDESLLRSFKCLLNSEDIKQMAKFLNISIPDRSFHSLLPMMYMETHLEEWIKGFKPVYEDLLKKDYYNAGLSLGQLVSNLCQKHASQETPSENTQKKLEDIFSSTQLSDYADILTCIDPNTLVNIMSLYSDFQEDTAGKTESEIGQIELEYAKKLFEICSKISTEEIECILSSKSVEKVKEYFLSIFESIGENFLDNSLVRELLSLLTSFQP